MVHYYSMAKKEYTVWGILFWDGAAGIRLHFLLRRKLLFRCRPAGIDQAATGSLDLIFESRCKAKKKDTLWGVLLFVFGEHYRCYSSTLLQRIIGLCPHPYWVRS